MRSKRYLIRAGRQSYLETMDEDIPKPHEDSKMPVAGVPSLFNSLLFDVCNGKWPFILPGQSQSQDDSDTSHSGASKFLFMGFVAISSLSVLYNCNRAVTLIFFFAGQESTVWLSSSMTHLNFSLHIPPTKRIACLSLILGVEENYIAVHAALLGKPPRFIYESHAPPKR